MAITVYTKPNCMQCEMTKKYFDARQIPYDLVDITKDEVSLQKMIDMGFQSAPIVITDHDKWAGFKVAKLAETTERYAS